MQSQTGSDSLTGTGRHQYFKYKVLEDATLQQRLSKGWWHKQQASCEGWSERLGRGLRLAGFLVSFLLSLFRAMAPWGLAMVELGTMLLLYFLLTPHQPDSFRYTDSLDDVVIISLARFPAVILAYGLGLGERHQKPYWYTALLFAGVGLTYDAVKLCMFHNVLRTAPLVIMLAFAGFCIAHLLTAKDVMNWAKRRYEMGLMGFGYPWEEGEADFARYSQQNRDVPVRALADPDSQFVSCNGLDVHYKEAVPEVGPMQTDTCVMLVHGFGAGVFAWRHVMQPLANRCRCRVVAFDRAGFVLYKHLTAMTGLTSRPFWKQSSSESNPYSNPAQAQLAIQLCTRLGLQRVVMLGHSDGALIALMAAAHIARSQDAILRTTPSMERNSLSQASGGILNAGSEVSTGMSNRHHSRMFMDDVEGQSHRPEVVGVGLLHPSFSGEARPPIAKLLGNSRLGRRLLRSLLRSEIGVVAHRKAWYDSGQLTPEVLCHYKAPLQVEGWDRALIEVGRASKAASQADITAAFRCISDIPSLIVVGAKDRIVPHASSYTRQLLHSRLSILPACGHLSHEESPGVLVGSLASFVLESVPAHSRQHRLNGG